MAEVKIPYGKTYIQIDTEKVPNVQVIMPEDIESEYSEEEVIKQALAKPIGNKGIEELKDAKNVVIVTCDNTRAVPNKLVMPILLDRLEELGVEASKITIIIGAGLHPPMPEDRFEEFLGPEVVSRVKVMSHDAKDQEQLVHLGETSNNTPIWINKNYANADAKIVVGMIDPHQFIGFSGGVKGVAIGVGGEKLIQANHSMLTKPNCRMGILEENPARQDLEEVGAIVGIDLILNVIVNNKKQVVKAVSGDFKTAHREGVKLAQEVCQVKAEEVDLVIASQGGYPKDVNLYQAQKALAHAAALVKQGGVIILVAECIEGVGEVLFEDTMKLDSNPQEVIDRFGSSEFKMGVHKAFLWARSLAKAKTILVSEGIDDEMAQVMMVTKAKSLEEALEIAGKELPENPTAAIMPKASSTIPVTE
ncbi:nickel-dependent lactate racemase [Desulfitispora alkaliphila]